MKVCSVFTTITVLFLIAENHLQAVSGFSLRDTTEVSNQTLQQQISDTLIQESQNVDTQKVVVDSLLQSKSSQEADSDFWEVISKVNLILGIFGSAILIWLVNRLVRLYNLKFLSYLKTIIQNFKEYEAFEDIGLDLVVDELLDQKTKSTVETESVHEIIQSKQAIQVLGKPGSGKTTSLKKLLLTYAKYELKKRSWKRKIPIYIEYRADNVFAHMIHFLHVNNPRKNIKYLKEEWLRNQLSKGKFIILIDDVHKIISTSSQKAESKIQDLLDYRLNKNKFVLMSRDYFRRSEFGFEVYKITDLSDDQIKRILRLHTNEHNAELIFNHIHWDPKLRALYDTPQMLSFLAKVFEKSGRIPLNKSNMFSQFFKMQNEEEEKKGAKYPVELKRRLLSYLALSMLRQQHNPFWIEEQDCLRVLNSRLVSLKSKYGYDASSTTDILDELLKSGLVIRYEDGIRFPHDQWQEYFAASEVFEEQINLESLKHLGSFAELAYFVAGFHTLEGDKKQKEDCQKFLEELIQTDFFLFSKCLDNFQSEERLFLTNWHEYYKDLVFSEDDVRKAYGKFLENYCKIIDYHFPNLRGRFEPETDKAIGIVVEKSDSRWGYWYAFIELGSETTQKVSVLNREDTIKRVGTNDENKLIDYYQRNYFTFNFKARDLDPVMYQLPIIGAYDDIENQLETLIRRRMFCESKEMLQEKLFCEAKALKNRLGIPNEKVEFMVKEISDGLRRLRIHETIQHKFLIGNSIDVRALNQEVERLFKEGFVPERKKGSTTFAGIYSRGINDAEFENTFNQFIEKTGFSDHGPIFPPLEEPPRRYFPESKEQLSDKDREQMIDWSFRYYTKIFNNYKEMIEVNFPKSKTSFETYSHFPIVMALVVDKDRFRNQGWLGERYLYGNVKSAENAVNIQIVTKESFANFHRKLYNFRWHHYLNWRLPLRYSTDEPLQNAVYEIILQEFRKLVD